MILCVTRHGSRAGWPTWFWARGTAVVVREITDGAGVAGEPARCYGGMAGLARVLWRRRLVFGGSPAAARRAVSAWRAAKVSRMRWLRTVSRQASHSVSGARPMRRHQPRAMVVVAGSLMVENVRSEPVRRA